jgi:hypothetical protein
MSFDTDRVVVRHSARATQTRLAQCRSKLCDLDRRQEGRSDIVFVQAFGHDVDDARGGPPVAAGRVELAFCLEDVGASRECFPTLHWIADRVRDRARDVDVVACLSSPIQCEEASARSRRARRSVVGTRYVLTT